MIGKHTRKLLRIGGVDARYRAAELLCAEWNRQTNPAKLRTDWEHKRCRQLAKLIRQRLAQEGLPYHETESGRAVSVYRRCTGCIIASLR